MAGDAMLPSGTVTLLLADVEGSTSMWQRDSAEARSAMLELDVLAAELIERFGGARPLEQGEGDSFVAAFARAADGIACALELQKRLADGALRIRVALHTGDTVLRDEKRYDGPTIIRTARVRDLGHGGQTLVSSTTRDLVLDAMPDGASLVDVGSHALKGLDRPERVWQLTHPELASTFPPLRSGETKSASLPVRLSTFIGRTSELADVQELVRTNRLVTLTGAGGCGKTRLAIEAVAEIEDDFPDGVWFCDLGPLADPSVVAQTLRTTIGLPDSAAGDDIGIVTAHLADANALIVLDNCEHVIDASAAVAHSLLAGCRVRVVATSREPLGIDGELAWRVPSLQTPEGDVPAPQQLAAFDAITLFVDRAAKARPNFVLDATNAAAVVEICRRLDGIPLAIELAAARVRVLSVQQIADGLNDRFRLLGRSSRTTLERQQTLFASVGWSHDLLTNAQRLALHRLSVFAGGFTLAGAEHVASGDGIEASEVLELVSQLVDRSLLVADERTGGVRYRMLETIRQFARDRLVDSGEAMDVADRHLDFFTEWAEGVFTDFDLGADVEALTLTIVDDYDNIRAACEWALDHERYEMGLRLTSALDRFWNAHASAREAGQWLETFLERTPDAAPITRLRGLIALNAAKEYFNDIEAATAIAHEALPLARACDDPQLLLRLLLRLGLTTGYLDPDQGEALLQEAVELARATNDDLALCEALYSLGQIYMFDDRSLAASREGLRIAEPYGDAVSARIRFNLGFGLFAAGEFEAALPELVRAKAAFVALGDDFLSMGADACIGAVALVRGDLAEAHRLLDTAIVRAQVAERPDAEAMFGYWCTALALAEGRLDDAQRFSDAGRPFYVNLPGPMGAAMRMGNHATKAAVGLAMGDVEAARSSVRAVLDEGGDDGPIGVWNPLAFGPPARVLRALGETSEAESVLVEGLRVVSERRTLFAAPDLIETAAALRADVAADADAARLFGAADVARERMGAVRLRDPIFDADAEIAALREKLGPQAFDESWASGRELSLDDALEFAMRGRGPRQRPQAGWDSLTPTELKVVELVAQGLSNPQVAERLFISRRTVSTHLSHVFAKLGVTSRSELAAEATKRGIDA